MSRVTFFIAVLTLLFSFPLFSDTQHVVAKGETLYSISRKYGVTVNELCNKNNITQSQVLKAGQKLVIPSMELSHTETYIVAKGDTFYGVARRHNITVEELLKLNGLKSSDTLKIGQVLTHEIIQARRGILGSCGRLKILRCCMFQERFPGFSYLPKKMRRFAPFKLEQLCSVDCTVALERWCLFSPNLDICTCTQGFPTHLFPRENMFPPASSWE